jgi:hypothetical protein
MDKTTTIIEETVARLPQEIQTFVRRKCAFKVFAPGGLGCAIPPDVRRGKWIIVVSANVDADDAHGIVAHEIAHAWLGHREGHVAEEEDAAMALTASWEFTGAGAGWPEDDLDGAL